MHLHRVVDAASGRSARRTGRGRGRACRRPAPARPCRPRPARGRSIVSICGGNVIAPTSTLPGAPGAPWRSARDFSTTFGDELVVDRLLDVDALDRHADLPAVAHRPLRRPCSPRARGRRRAARSSGPCRRARATRGSAARRRAPTLLPVAVEPVNMIMSTLSTSAAPVAPAPVATWNTSAGSRRARAALADHQLASGVTSLGFSTTALPAISAGIAVAEAVRQRVVPGADHADDAERPVPHDDLLADSERRVGRTSRRRGTSPRSSPRTRASRR